MPDKNTPTVESNQREQLYEEALKEIAGGTSWEAIVAKSALGDKSRNPLKRGFDWVGKNLAAFTGVIVAISGIVFWIVQYNANELQNKADLEQRKVEQEENQSKNKRELKLNRVEALNNLIPSMTGDNPTARKYALAALFALYSSPNEGFWGKEEYSEDEKLELKILADNFRDEDDIETLAILAQKADDEELKKKAAREFAIRAKKKRDEAGKEGERQEWDKQRDSLQAARSDAQKAIALDSRNANAIYQHARTLMELLEDQEKALEELMQVINLVESKEYREEHSEFYPRAYLNKTICLVRLDRPQKEICSSYEESKAKMAKDFSLEGDELKKAASLCEK